MTDDSGALQIREAGPEDDADIVALWTECGLVTGWNPPQTDIDRLRESGHGALLLGQDCDGGMVATVMVGHDGHRGWLYYLAVDPGRQRQGHGRRMVAAAEAWLQERGLPKAMLMVRVNNSAVETFYRKLGYGIGSVNLLQRWLTPPAMHVAEPGKREVTVTYLEMDQRPMRPAAAPPAVPHAIMRLHQPDIAFYRFMHDTIGRRWLWYERRLIDDESLAEIVHDEAVEVFVLYVHGNPAGFVEIDRRERRVADIRFLGVMESQIGRGLGRYLLSWSIEQAWQGPTERVTVNTCTLDHPRALTLYQRAGFSPVRQETSLIDDPALLIRRLERAAADAPATEPAGETAQEV